MTNPTSVGEWTEEAPWWVDWLEASNQWCLRFRDNAWLGYSPDDKGLHDAAIQLNALQAEVESLRRRYDSLAKMKHECGPANGCAQDVGHDEYCCSTLVDRVEHVERERDEFRRLAELRTPEGLAVTILRDHNAAAQLATARAGLERIVGMAEWTEPSIFDACAEASDTLAALDAATAPPADTGTRPPRAAECYALRHDA